MLPMTLLYPVLVQVALTFGLLFWMGSARLAALRRREVEVGQVALGEKAWPAQVQKISNSFHNQFELPMLFYAAAGLAIALGALSPLLVSLAWLFVALRLAHAIIHTSMQNIQARFLSFLAGALVLLALWAVLAVTTLSAGH